MFKNKKLFLTNFRQMTSQTSQRYFWVLLLMYTWKHYQWPVEREKLHGVQIKGKHRCVLGTEHRSVLYFLCVLKSLKFIAFTDVYWKRTTPRRDGILCVFASHLFHPRPRFSLLSKSKGPVLQYATARRYKPLSLFVTG